MNLRAPLLAWLVLFLCGAWGRPAAASPPVVPRSALPEIELQLRADDPGLQLRAVGQLLYIQGGSSDYLPLLPRILELTQSDDPRVARVSLYLMGQASSWPEARRQHGLAMVVAIREAMQSKDPGVRSAAMHAMMPALVDENPTIALSIFLAAVTDERATIRGSATVGMGRLQDAKAVAALRKALADPAVQVRRHAALALAELAPASEVAIPDLVVALRDSSAIVTGSAFHALGQMGDATLETLFSLTKDTEPRLRHGALETLCSGHMSRSSLSHEDAQRIISIAQHMLDDPSPSVRTTAAIRVSICGNLEAMVVAVPVLVDHVSGKESLEGWNAYLGLHRCIRSFVVELTNAVNAPIALRGLQQLDAGYLRNYLREYHQRFESTERADIRPLLRIAAKDGVDPEHRRFAAQMLSWLPADEGRMPSH